MSTAPNYSTVVQELYVAYFGRPADYYGLQSFEAALTAANAPTTLAGLVSAYSTNSAVKGLIDSFGTSAESTTLYGAVTTDPTTAASFVNSIFENLFNRPAAVSGLTFWVDAITSGALSLGNVALAIAAGASANTSTLAATDVATFNNKVTVASNFTTGLTTTADIIGYKGPVAAADARSLIGGVSSTTVAATYQANVESTITAISSIVTGTTVSLTTGVDTVTAQVFNGLIGSSAALDTLNPFDSLTGSTTNNILNIEIARAGAVDLTGVTLHNVQTVNLSSTGTASMDLTTTTGFGGVTNLNVLASTGADSLTAASTVALSVVDSAGAVTLTGGSSQTVTTTGDVTLTKAAGAILVTEAAQAASVISIDGGTSVTVSASTTGTGTTGTITIGATTAPTGVVTVVDNLTGTTTGTLTGGAITITGGTTVSVTENAAQPVLTVAGANESVTLAAVNVTGTSATTSVTVVQTPAATEVDTVLPVTAVTETGSAVFAALTAGQTLIVEGLTFTAGAAGTTAAQTAAAFANLTSGAYQGNSVLGTYSGQLAGWATGAMSGTSTVLFSSTVAGNVADLAFTGTGAAPTITETQGVAKVTGTGTGQIIDGVVTILDANYASATAANTITSVVLSGADSGASISSSALANLSLSNTVSSIITVNDKTATALALTVNGVSSATLNLDGVVGTYKTLNITTAGSTGSSLDVTATGVTALTVAGTESINLSGSTFTALKTVVVSGSAGVTIDVSADASFTDFNASATSGSNFVTIDGTTTFEGGSGGDTVTLTAAPTKAIAFGAGNDTVILASGTVTAPAGITGGAGVNTVEMVAADAVTASGSATFATQVTGFEVLSLTGGTGAQTVHVDVLGHYNTVSTGAEVAGGVLTLSGFTSGGTLDLTSSSTAAYVVTNAAWTAAAPAAAFNIDVVGSGAIAAGTVTASNVTALSIGATDTGAHAVAGGTLDSLTVIDTAATSIVVTGNANLTLTTTGDTSVSTINASGMTGSITVTAAGVVAETITGGAAGGNHLTASVGTLGDTLVGNGGHDVLTANAGLDTLTGGGSDETYVVTTASANANSYAEITNAHVGDTIQISATAVSFNAAAITLASTAVFQDYANAAVHTSGVAGAISWFQYGGNTYIVENAVGAESSFTNGVDHIVELQGLISLTHTSLSTSHGSLLIG